MKQSTIIGLAIALVLGIAHAQPSDVPADATVVSVPGNVPQVVAPNNQDSKWRPTDAQRERVIQAVRTYLAAKDERRFSDAYALFTPAQKAVVPFGKWEADMKAAYSTAGAAQGRTLKRVTWYNNPPNAPPGIFAAVDFSSQFTELALHCGFVALQLQMDGSFGIAREEENSIPKREMAKLSPEALQKIRSQFGC